MKGTLKKSRVRGHEHGRTKFNDWSDPKCKPLRKRIERGVERHTKVSYDEIEEVNDNIPQIPPVISRTTFEIDEIAGKISRRQPLLSQKEIRKVRLPFYESLIINLKEDGFIATSTFIKDLIKHDEQLHTQSIIPSGEGKPLLKDDVGVLNSLSAGLMQAEVAKMKGDINKEARHLLDLAMHFSSLNGDWNWLAEELFEQCTDLSIINQTNAENRISAIAKHMYASFLLNNLHDLQRAKLYVEESMKLSVGKSWNFRDITGGQEDLLYFESCFLIQQIFLGLAIEQECSNIDYAVQLCRSSLDWAIMGNSKTAQATSLLQLVHIYLRSGKTSNVLRHLKQYMKLCTELADTNGLCEGYILMAKYHELNKEIKFAIKDMLELLKLAEENGIDKMKATAHCKLATFFLMQNDIKGMQEHAVKAYYYFTQLNTHDIDEARCLSAIAIAQEIMEKYICMVVETKSPQSPQFNNFMSWITLRIPFFSNVKLIQPIGELNASLKRRWEAMKKDEVETASKAKEDEINADKVISMFRIRTKKDGSKPSVMSSSRSVVNFNEQMVKARASTSIGSIQTGLWL